MRIVHRHRHHRGKGLRISISQEEITADLHYPTRSRQPRQATTASHRVGNR